MNCILGSHLNQARARATRPAGSLRTSTVLPLLFCIGSTACTGWRSGYPDISASLGGGFAGIHTASVIVAPVFDNTGKLDSTLADLRANSFTQWRPAVSTGLVARWRQRDDVRAYGPGKFPDTVPGPSVGFGVHMVFLSNSKGDASPWPAATINVGNRLGEAFFGLIFSPTDEVRFPGGGNTFRLHRTPGVADPDFVQQNVGYSRHVFAGFEIQGVRLSAPK